MPLATAYSQIETVIPLGRSSSTAKVGEVATCVAGSILVVTDDRICRRFKAAPAVLVAHLEVRECAAVVLQITQCEDALRRHSQNQVGCLLHVTGRVGSGTAVVISLCC